ncbi:MAG: aminopeptidase N [Beijerinckiaceae bacterium]|nr:aminopeptidase N [Beijerinckiaceae bacterium]
MRSDMTPVIRLKDYRAPDYFIDTVHLDVALAPDRTRIVARLTMRPNPAGTAGAALALDGDELDLVSLALDGTALTEADYTVTPQRLVLSRVPKAPFVLTIETVVNPESNTKLMGLYRSNGIYCTQCEAEGFRRITYFLDRPDVMSVYTVRLEGDLLDAPVLLANGNPVETGRIEGTDRHYAVWHDPHPKPAYLFALVGGDLGSISEPFVTATGRKVQLNIYVERGKEDRASYAMDALRRSMRWDEQVFGCPYDLDVFNVVAVSDFNMGAMENKGLNIFNDKYVLATPETATDLDYANIEAIIAHEYFHNWTGNRITCRDWFQLCLKEGLTVFRDQEFSSDMRSRAVKRIEDVVDLRERQFGEDAGPLAHPVRPEAYSEINNFYTATIYEKGAELVRMVKLIVGASAFKRGMDLYLTRCDGTAATVEDFIGCFAEASGRMLDPFMLWYSQAGTPVVTAKRAYDASKRSLTITFSQDTGATPGQPVKEPVPIPITVALVKPDGSNSGERLFVLEGRQQSVAFDDVDDDAVPSLLRGFSAPVNLETDLTDDDLSVLARHDNDPFNRWQAIQTLTLRTLVERTADSIAGRACEPDRQITAALRSILETATSDMAFAAFALRTPSVQEIARSIGKNVDPQAVQAARHGLRAELGRSLIAELTSIHARIQSDEPYSPEAAGAGRRALSASLLGLMSIADPEAMAKPLYDLATSASNMTDRASALSLLTLIPGERRETALAQFAARYADDPLVLDKWFAMNATIPELATLDRVKALMAHPHYTITNPNRFRSLVGSFAFGNFTEFNRADGEGYQFVAELTVAVDRVNPQVAARMATAFRTWKTLKAGHKAHARMALQTINESPKLSIDLRDIIERTLT